MVKATRFRALLALLVIVAMGLAVGFAQETTAGLQGTVKDQSGAVVVGATVEVTSPSLIGYKKTAVTDAGGYFHIAQLPSGTYALQVTAKNFRGYRQEGITLEVGHLPTIDPVMQVGTASETVEVTGEAPLVDVTQSKVQTNVTATEISSLPTGRSFQSVIPFAPGARQEQLQSRTTDQGKLNGFQIDGASDAENVYMTEGLNTTSIYGGGVGANVPMEFIQEVQVKSSSFEAEYGGATGGVVNVIQKRGSNFWHGSVGVNYRSDAISANDDCTNHDIGAGVSVCNLRLTPGTSLNSGSAAKLWSDRQDGVAQRYVQKPDQWDILEPGFEVGGPIFKNKLWLFSSYVPQLYTVTRTVNFTGANPGPRAFTQQSTQQNFMNRLDYSPFSSLRLFASWQSGYTRVRGNVNFPGADSAIGQVNTSAGTDPNTLRTDTGYVSPLTILNFGGDWTVGSHMVVTGRVGSFYTNAEDRGKVTGTRYVWQVDNTGVAGFPAADQHTAGFFNIGSNSQSAFDVFSRKQYSGDVSYFLGHFGGTHNFKVGFQASRQAENVANTFNTSLVNIFATTTDAYTTASGPTSSVCSAVIAKYGKCAGPYGYYTLRDGVLTNGNVSAWNHSLYFQDAWTIKGRLTINAGVRLDNEYLPPYRPGASSISFGFGQKIGPRVGAAYDVLNNGKLKVYASYGKFYDIMKYSLPRGSFGGDRWHDCVYALTTPDYTQIVPTNVGGKFCPDSGPAVGSLPGDFIENQNWRASAPGDPTDPVVDPNMKPMSTHEFVAGADWQIKSNLALETRYARKRLDNTIEDMSLDDGQYYIGNPGSAYSQLLHRALPNAGYSAAVCPTCPNLPKATRDYDGIEFRLIRRASEKWFGQISYTYSRLDGNYPGLSDTYFLDGGGGRHEPNNNRAFDLPQMLFDGKGHAVGGPLPTDRPNVISGVGYYRLKWAGMESTFGFTQIAESGTPQSTCLPTVDSQSSCMFVAGQGNWINFHQASNGDIVQDSVSNGKRTPFLTQSDFSFTHALHVSKTNEAMKVSFTATMFNVFNQHAPLALYNSPLAGGYTTPTAANAVGWDYLSLMNNFDYLSLMNNKTTNAAGTAYAGPNTNGKPNTLASRYGAPIIYQNARNMRLEVRFTF
ncbi:MAG: TonB-dependent receptor [Terriglobales bacterium]